MLETQRKHRMEERHLGGTGSSTRGGGQQWLPGGSDFIWKIRLISTWQGGEDFKLYL